MTNDKLMYNGTVLADGGYSYDECCEYETVYVVEPEPVVKSFGYRRGDIVWCAGKVIRVWDDWYGVWVIWYALKLYGPFRAVMRKLFIRRFRGIRRGRHWNRKREI